MITVPFATPQTVSAGQVFTAAVLIDDVPGNVFPFLVSQFTNNPSSYLDISPSEVVNAYNLAQPNAPTIRGYVNVLRVNTATAAPASTLTVTGGGSFSGSITGANLDLTVDGGNQTLVLSGNNSYGGATTINSGATLQAGSTTALSATSTLSDAGTLDLAGFNNSVAALSSTGWVINSASATTATLTVSGGGIFSGVVGASTGTTTISGAGMDYQVIDTNDSGAGTLRQAILNANQTTPTSTITFAIPGSGVQIIQPLSALPTIAASVAIDGTSQPGYNGVPPIALSGASAGSHVSGLVVAGGNSTVKGLVISQFSGDGIDLTTNGGDVIEGDYIGTDVTDTAALANGGSGVTVINSSSNTIGGTAPGSANLIAYNTGAGVAVVGAISTGNIISSDSISYNQSSGITNHGGTVTVSNCTLASNSALQGGGIYNIAGMLTVSNSTLWSNSASDGGGIANSGLLTVTNSTLADNSSSFGLGGGIANQNGGSAVLNNTIVADNTFGGDLYLDSGKGSVFAGAYDLIGDGSDVGSFSNSLHGDPLLASLGDYGGATQTMALLPGSPAIDAGNNSLAVAANGNSLTTDQRGFARIVGNAIDIGACESQGFTLSITSGNNQSTLVNTAFAAPLVVTMTAKDGVDPVAGGQITFTPPSGDASAALSPNNPVTIAVNGTASVQASANGSSGNYTVTVTTAGAISAAAFSLTNNPAQPAPVNVSSDVSVTRSGFRYDFSLHEFVQTVTITNTSSSALVGPLAFQLTGLSSNATLANATGTDTNGDPYVDFVSPTGQLAAGQSITVTLYFKDLTFKAIAYDAQVWQGY